MEWQPVQVGDGDEHLILNSFVTPHEQIIDGCFFGTGCNKKIKIPLSIESTEIF